MLASPKPRSFLRNVFLACATTLFLYAAGFWGIERLRERRGPWEVTFRVEGREAALIRIDHPKLGIAGVELRFENADVPPQTQPTRVRFAAPDALAQVPFGSVVFLDTTILPGTVTFDLFGHEIELLPRVLIIDKVEHPWESGRRYELTAREERPEAGGSGPHQR